MDGQSHNEFLYTASPTSFVETAFLKTSSIRSHVLQEYVTWNKQQTQSHDACIQNICTFLHKFCLFAKLLIDSLYKNPLTLISAKEEVTKPLEWKLNGAGVHLHFANVYFS